MAKWCYFWPYFERWDVSNISKLKCTWLPNFFFCHAGFGTMPKPNFGRGVKHHAACRIERNTTVIFIPWTGFWLHSISVHSGEHSGLNSGMVKFCQNILSLEWQFGRALCQTSFHQNPPESTGMTAFQQESVGQGKDLKGNNTAALNKNKNI